MKVVIYLQKSLKDTGFVLHVPDMASGNELNMSMLLAELLFIITKHLSGYYRFPIFFGCTLLYKTAFVRQTPKSLFKRNNYV